MKKYRITYNFATLNSNGFGEAILSFCQNTTKKRLLSYYKNTITHNQ